MSGTGCLGSLGPLWRSGADTFSNRIRTAESGAACAVADARSPPSQLPKVIDRRAGSIGVRTLTCRETGKTALRVEYPT